MNKNDLKEYYEIILNVLKNLWQIFLGYIRTIFISLCVSTFITVCICIHARNEMIKDYYASTEVQKSTNIEIAKRIVSEANLMENLIDKNYSTCMYVGKLYEYISDYDNAEIAYRYALRKAGPYNYNPYFKLARILISQEKFKEATELTNSVQDLKNKELIMFKYKTFLAMGDKYFSIGKFITAGKCYEKAQDYYNSFIKKDKYIEKALNKRVVNAYVNAADIMVRNRLDKDALVYLNKALKLDNDNLKIKYRLAIIYSDVDPMQSINIFEELMRKIPQDIDLNAYSNALIKSANIAELEGKLPLAKYYRYKIHSTDLFVTRKVIYTNDINVFLNSFIIKKFLFAYKLKASYQFENISSNDINKLYADFVLKRNGKVIETIKECLANEKYTLYSNGGQTRPVEIKFNSKIFSKKELQNYTLEIYIYKDKEFKTFLTSMKIPEKTIKFPQ